MGAMDLQDAEQLILLKHIREHAPINSPGRHKHVTRHRGSRHKVPQMLPGTAALNAVEAGRQRAPSWCAAWPRRAHRRCESSAAWLPRPCTAHCQLSTAGTCMRG